MRWLANPRYLRVTRCQESGIESHPLRAREGMATTGSLIIGGGGNARAITGAFMTEPIDVHERRDLCDLLLELGPDAPTLCTGWTTADMAAHLVLREHFHRWSDAQRAAEKAKGLPVLVARLRAGAPLIPWRIPRIRNVFNGLEYFIHHEDVRRANGRGPRPEMPELEALAWRMTGFSARRVARRIRPYSLELVRPDGSRRVFGSGAHATLRGPATELLLYLSGRRSTAGITLEGDPGAVAAIERADLSV
jgi:uncharacterized protein (TIGR03085 family)